MVKRVRMGRMINGVVFGNTTPQRHGNASSKAKPPQPQPKKDRT